MMVKALNGFRHFETDHCVTGSLRHLYAFHGHDLSEDMLLGLGEGVGFAYFHFKGQLPFLGGRAQPKPSMEEIVAGRTGVAVKPRASSSDAASSAALLRKLDQGEPAMLQVDMGFLPYFDFGGTEYHFGGHVIVVCGHDPGTDTFLVADRDSKLHPVPARDLVAARGSRHRPFPPNRLTWEFDFSGFHAPRPADMLAAAEHQCALMLSPPIANIGVKGIRKAAGEIGRWDSLLQPSELKGALFNAWIFIDKTGGTGGGAFRRMFSRFLHEAAAAAGAPALETVSKAFGVIADAWDVVAVQCRKASEGPGRGAMTASLPEISRALLAIADREEEGWRSLETGLRSAGQ
jgi:hypothetical protein